MSTSVSVDKSLQPLLWLVAIGLFMQTLDSTIVNTALPAMARSLSESPLKMQSVIIAYTLTTAMLMPASGWLADRFGTRRMFFVAIFLLIGLAIQDVLKRGNVPRFGRFIVWLVLFLGCAGFVAKGLIEMGWEGSGIG